MPDRSQERSSEPAPRKRLSAAAARERILEAAQRKLAEVGPEGLRLTELAAELSISHPAILHHFGSREDLVQAVVERAMDGLNQRLAEALAGQGKGGRVALLDMIAEFYGAAGNARLIAWLVLSQRTSGTRTRGTRGRPLERVIELAHARRSASRPGRRVDFEETKFRSQLTALALLGDAIFGDLIRHSSGDPIGPDASRAFRRRLAQLLQDTD